MKVSCLRGCDASCDRPVSERRYDPRLMRNASVCGCFTAHQSFLHYTLNMNMYFSVCLRVTQHAVQLLSDL